jgi:hypothetical protein
MTRICYIQYGSQSQHTIVPRDTVGHCCEVMHFQHLHGRAFTSLGKFTDFITVISYYAVWTYKVGSADLTKSVVRDF